MSDTKRYTMTSFIMKLRETGQKHPIFVILSIAFIFRLFVAILLPDSGDFNIRERFLYFKMPIAWIDESTEYLSNQTYDEPQGISLFYLSLNYAWLALFKFIGINDISWLTFIGRLLHTFVFCTFKSSALHVFIVIIEHLVSQMTPCKELADREFRDLAINEQP